MYHRVGDAPARRTARIDGFAPRRRPAAVVIRRFVFPLRDRGRLARTTCPVRGVVEPGRTLVAREGEPPAFPGLVPAGPPQPHPLGQRPHLVVRQLVQVRRVLGRRARLRRHHRRRRRPRPEAAAVADAGHLHPEDAVGRLPPPLLIGRPEFAAQGEQRFGTRLVEHLAAGGEGEGAVGGAGVAGEPAQLVGVGGEAGGDGLPRRPAGAAGGGPFEQFGIENGCVGHGGTGGNGGEVVAGGGRNDVTTCSVHSRRGKSNQKVRSCSVETMVVKRVLAGRLVLPSPLEGEGRGAARGVRGRARPTTGTRAGRGGPYPSPPTPLPQGERGDRRRLRPAGLTLSP